MACSLHGITRIVLALFVCSTCLAQDVFIGRTIASGLRIPWDIAVDRDSVLWFTERAGLIHRLDIRTGNRTQVADLRSTTYAVGEAGLTALMLHPSFPDSPFVYVVATRDVQGERYRSVMRLRWDGAALHDPTDVLVMPGWHFTHQGARMLTMPDTTMLVTMGDNAQWMTSQDSASFDGKVLRMRLDGTVPSNNPIPGSYMYAMGLRNPQGITQLPNGRVFTAEHGNANHDEINEIVPGANYGWPMVEGPCAQVFDQQRCDSLGLVDPFFSTGPDTWAMSGLTWYNHDRYPSLKNSLLCLALKNASMYQLRLSDDGRLVDTVIRHLDFMYGRLRAICVTNDGRIFVATSNHEANGRFPFPTDVDDRILEVVPLRSAGPATVQAQIDTVFGFALPGDETEYDVNLRNVGDSIALVRYINIGGLAGGGWLSHWNHHDKTFQIPPKEQRRARLKYVPQMHGSHVDMVEFAFDRNSTGNIVLPLIGSTQVGRLRASVDTIVLSAEVRDSAKVAITLVNDGVEPVTTQALVVVEGDSSLFHVEIERDLVVQPMQEVQAYIVFKPTSVATHQAVVEVQSSGYRATHFRVLANGLVSSVNHDDPPISMASHAVPNPFDQRVTITLSRPSTLRIFDVYGRCVWSAQGAPVHSWDGVGIDGERLPAGSYVAVDGVGHVVSTLLYLP